MGINKREPLALRKRSLDFLKPGGVTVKAPDSGLSGLALPNRWTFLARLEALRKNSSRISGSPISCSFPERGLSAGAESVHSGQPRL